MFLLLAGFCIGGSVSPPTCEISEEVRFDYLRSRWSLIKSRGVKNTRGLY